MAAEQGQLPTSLQLVTLPAVLDSLVEQAHTGLQQLASTLPGLQDEERKRALLRYLHASRQQLQRLHVAVVWSNKAKAVAEVKRLLEVAATHGHTLTETADTLCYLHGELEDMKGPLYDVPTAVHVLETGTYKLLPTTIEEQGGVPPPVPREAQRWAALRRMDFLLRSKLLATQLPEGMVLERVRGGVAQVAVPGQYSAELTLVPAPRDEVTLAKYRPPEDAQPSSAGPAVDIEVTQGAGAPAGEAPGSAAAPMDLDAQPGASGSAAAAASSGAGQSGRVGEAGAAQEADRWRWLLVSFKLLPEWQSESPPIAPNQAAWLQRQLEDKMWRAADAQQLVRLGAASSLLHFPQLPQPARQAAQPAASQRPATPAASMLSAPPAAGAEAPEAGPEGSSEALAAAAAAAGGTAAAAGAGSHAAEGAEASAPDWATCPLRLMHSVLRQAAGRLTVYSLVLTEARRLEKGAWEGLLRISRSGGAGLRFAYWLTQPLVTHGQLLALHGQPQPAELGGSTGGGSGAGGGATAAGTAPGAPALEVNLEDSGALVCTHTPALYSPGSSQPVQLQLSPASLSIEELLLAVAAHNAATQLAAIQAALERDQQWASLGVTLHLVPPSHLASSAVGPTPHAALQAAGSGGSTAVAGAGPALLFHVAGDASPFLALTVLLKTAKLSLAAGPALLELWGGDAAPAQPGAAGGSAAGALVAAAQQRLERCEKDALTLPLASAPQSVAALVQQGGSRGVLAAGLAAGELAALCQRLVRRRRLAGVAAAAARLGLLPGLPLPLLLLQDYLRQAPLPRAPLAGDALTLALPGFQPPADMVAWQRVRAARRAASALEEEAERQLRQLAKQQLPLLAGGPPPAGPAAAAAAVAGAALNLAQPAAAARANGECGAARAHLLVEYQEGPGQENAGGVQQGAAAAGAAAAAGQQQQQQRADGGSGGAASFRLSLVVSSCSARGTVKRVLKVLPLPPHLLTAPAAQPAAAAGARAGAKRKRSAAEEEEQAAAEGGDGVLRTAVPSPDLRETGSSTSSSGELPPLQSAVEWCCEAAAWEQLLLQLRALRVPFTEEWRLSPSAGSGGPQSLGAAAPPAVPCSAAGCHEDAVHGHPAPRRVLRLSCPPALAKLEAWAVQQRSAGRSGLPSTSTGHTACSAAAPAAAGRPGADGPVAEGAQAAVEPGVLLELDPCSAGAGAWTSSITSSYLTQLPQLFSRHRVRVDLPSAPAGTTAHDAAAAPGGAGSSSILRSAQGVVMRHELQKGDSALTSVTDVLRMLRLHLCVTRLASLMLSDPLGPHCTSGSTPNSHNQHAATTGGNGALLPGGGWGPGGAGKAGAAGSKGGAAAHAAAMANGYHAGGANGLSNGGDGGLDDPFFADAALAGPHDGGKASAAAEQQQQQQAQAAAGSAGEQSALLWGLPLCGTVSLVEVGLTQAVLLVTPAAPPEQQQQPRVAGGPGAPAAAGAAAAPIRLKVEWVSQSKRSGDSAAAAPGGPAAAAGPKPEHAASGSGFVRCQLSAEPPLPAPLLCTLAAQLEAGAEAEFLDALCLAAGAAAALQHQVAGEGLRAAGLLPGAAALLPGAAGSATRSALRLALRAQHAQRTLHLQLQFGRGGYTLLRLLGSSGCPAWAEAGWARACTLPGCHAAADAAAGHAHAKQAWCALGTLGAAVAQLLAALARGEEALAQA